MSVRNGMGRWIAGGLATAAIFATTAMAQAPRQHELSSTRRARILRTIEDTYSHRWEAAGGGGYLRWRSGENLQKNNEVSFWATTTYFLNPKLGITGDVRGAYGNARIQNTIFNLPDPQISEYTFLGGVTYRLYSKEDVAISAYGLGGSALGKFSGGAKGITDVDLGLWPSSNAKPAASAGVNFDYNFFPYLAFRGSPTYVWTNFGGTSQNSFGINFGLVYRFGRIHQ